MTETNYRIEGMTCMGCVKGVEQKLMNVEQIHAVAVDLQSGEAKITTADLEVPLSSLQEILGSKYQISAKSTAGIQQEVATACLLYTSPSPRDLSTSRMPSSA